jgi:hypothetical protein
MLNNRRFVVFAGVVVATMGLVALHSDYDSLIGIG